jgi:Tfp pilus assembly protein PilF
MPQKARNKRSEQAVNLSKAGETEAALAAFHRALKRSPNDPDLLNNIGVTLAAAGLHAEAAMHFDRATEIKPDFAEAHCNLGLVSTKMGYYSAAQSHFTRSLELNPRNANAYHSRAVARLYAGHFAAAGEDYDKALQLDPGNADAHRDRAYFRLLMGDYKRGFAEYHWRYRTDEAKAMGHIPPEHTHWDGRDLAGKRLLIRAEQGLGDTIQFVRYLPMVKERGNPHITLVLDSSLISIVDRMRIADEIIPYGFMRTRFDYWCSLIDLAGVFGTELGTTPSHTPYLAALHWDVDVWRRRIPKAGMFNVGLRWRGSSSHGRDKDRSFSVDTFIPLLTMPGCQFFSLQPEHRPLQGIIDWAAEFDLTNFEDAAAACSVLDLIITVDTSLAHLAGALNRPVWNLLSFVPDWRWLLNRSDSPWYPSMRLFRQTAPGLWAEAIGRVRDLLVEATIYNAFAKGGQ